MEIILIALIAYCVIFAFFTAAVAGSKKRSRVTWFVLGFLFNALALLAVGFMAPADK